MIQKDVENKNRRKKNRESVKRIILHSNVLYSMQKGRKEWVRKVEKSEEL